MTLDPQAAKQMLTAMLQPWHNAVADPAAAQEDVIETLLRGYARTEYGQELTFNRYGAAYSVTIECDDPRYDPRCNNDIYARQVANGMIVAAGSPDGQGER